MNKILFECVNCQRHEVIANGQDGNTCHCGGYLNPLTTTSLPLTPNHRDKPQPTEGGAVDVAIDIINSFSDEIEELHAAYGNAQKEISDLKNHNDTLIEQVKRLERRSRKTGMKLLKCKNDLRNPSVEDNAWKKYNKANRSGGNG